VQLPQTIHFGSRPTLDRARRIVDSHPRFHLLVRDARSLDIARREFDVPSSLCPDMAFCLGPLDRSTPPVTDVVWLSRTDAESAHPAMSTPMLDGLGSAGLDGITTLNGQEPDLPRDRRVHAGARPSDPHDSRSIAPPGAIDVADWIDEPVTPLLRANYALMGLTLRAPAVRFPRQLLMRTFEPLARQRLGRGLHILSAGRVVITDRLHGHILSLLLSIPHVLLDNSYGKIASFYETWTRESSLVRFAGSAGEAVRIAREWIEGGVRTVTDRDGG
jgi:pyruvyl transferase EpsO